MEATQDDNLPTTDFKEMKLGMEFDSEQDAYEYYHEYAGQTGFSIRKEYTNKSKRHGHVTSRKFTCSKEGHRVQKNVVVKTHRKETRTDCLAHIIIKRQLTGRYQVTSFEENHNHPLFPKQYAHKLPSKRKIASAEPNVLELANNSGVTISSETRSNLKNSFLATDDQAITKMQSNLSMNVDGEQNGDLSNSVAASSNEFSSIEITRFDGKNYHYWAEQMELFLKQLQIAYVVNDPCPIVALSPQTSDEESSQAKAAKKKWMNDDYLCRHCILSSLSDNLYYQFSKKTKTAKELWEELKLAYLYEEFGAKQSQVRKYIEFQFVEDRPIVEQMQELNCIADSIVAAGMMIAENFHVSVIISKLPPSWKDFSIKMMREENLSFWRLMNNAKVEEESRNRAKQAEHSTFASFHLANNTGPDTRLTGVPWKKRNSETNKKRHHRNTHEANREQNGESSTVPVVSNVDIFISNV